MTKNRLLIISLVSIAIMTVFGIYFLREYCNKKMTSAKNKRKSLDKMKHGVARL